MNTYLAHSTSTSGRVDPIATHLTSVADLAADFASMFGAEEEARAAAVCHDLGKYGDLFGARLLGKARKIDHWSIGAWIALSEYKRRGIASALVAQGHHIGLQQASVDALGGLNPAKLKEVHPLQLRLSDANAERILRRFHDDALQLPQVEHSIYNWPRSSDITDMLDVRMLFSTVVDADYLETEAHFNAPTSDTKGYRSPGPTLEPGRALATLKEHLAHLGRVSTSAPHVNALRSDLLQACLSAGSLDQGLFTLTAPTGAGKTLAMMAFALKHALVHDLRRVIVVIPYLSIIDQSVKAYRTAFSALGNDDWLRTYVLEHHSLAGLNRGEKEPTDADGVARDQQRLLAENWDAPIIVTTSVQMLESLFANRPGPCRKLHRLAKSVILFDEVQTLPLHLAIPTLGTLSRLSQRYETSVVFSTATQPAFAALSPAVESECGQTWHPREIVPPELKLFDRARRTQVLWPDMHRPMPWRDVAERIRGLPQVLCIVNMKRHAFHLLDALADEPDIFHLSTNMCPSHRDVTLTEIRERLKAGKPCRLISTQCVEAGVDVDFPVVLRAWGPLESIVQAAGRCNRNGARQLGPVELFMPDDHDSRLYPDGAYERAAKVAEILLREIGPENIDVNDERLFWDYYERLYVIADPQDLAKELMEAGITQDFPEVARLYRLIDTDAINVLVPYDIDHYSALANEVRDQGLSAAWMAKARAHSIGLFRPRGDDPLWDWVEPTWVGTRHERSHDWYIYLNQQHYDQISGLRPPTSMQHLVV